MRIIRLDLKAFGPFTDRGLDFSSERPGLHIVFGPNEAGKSSSLRALKSLLFGFPERTSDNFRHANDQLLVGGGLEGADGSTLTFYRRKKRKADLLDANGNPLDPGTLAPFLHGLEPALFESLYGIDHRTLVQGGEDILAQKGEVGQALFAAGAGISSLKKIMDLLVAEAEELFKPRGTKQQINQAVKKYKDLKKLVKEVSLPSSKWKEHKKRLQEAEAEQAELEKTSGEIRAEIQRLDRLSRAIPLLAELDNLHIQVKELGEVVLLGSEFIDQIRNVEQGIRETGLRLENDRERLQKIEEKLCGIFLNQSLLDHAETIEDLHQRLGEYRKGLTDRSRLEGMRIANRRDAAALLEEIRPDLLPEEAENLRPVLNRKRTIQDLSSRRESLLQQKLRARHRKEEAERELESLEALLTGLPGTSRDRGLADRLKMARREGDIDGRIEELSREIDEDRKSCRSELKRLGLWAGGLEELSGLTLPLPQTARRFESLFNEIDQEKIGLETDRRKTEEKLKAARQATRELEYGGEIPTEFDLTRSRQKRQEGWGLLLRQWLHGEDISREAEAYGPGLPLTEAYERQVELTDHLADRLRREADRVARAASLRAEMEGLEEQSRDIALQEDKLTSRERELTATWQAEWQSAGITPRSPAEMLAWLDGIEVLRRRAVEITARENEINRQEAVRRKHHRNLAEELQKLGRKVTFSESELTPVLTYAESVLEETDRQKAELEKLTDSRDRSQKTLEKAAKELTEAEAAETEWQHDWQKALSGLGLSEEISTSEALDILDVAEKCLARLEKAAEFQSRIKGIDRDVAKFKDDVRNLLAQTAPDLRELPPDQAVLNLHNLLAEARQLREFRRTSNREKEKLTTVIGETEKKRRSLNEQMSSLLAAAGCNKPGELAEAIRKSAELQRLREKISDTGASLAGISEGLPDAEIRSQAAEIEVDKLPGRIEALRREVEEELYPRIKEASRIIGEEQRELRHMDGSSQAAEAAEEMERTAAGIKRLVEQYTRLKLAAGVLEEEIEHYRQEHQDPVLKIASRFFVELTLGSFSGLRADVDDSGHPILVGIRPDDTRVFVQGMSDGTCDQLYLALRLATLEWRLENGEAMPFIVDDILINFDDRRAAATLQALAGLGNKNQVILFTHHRQIIETAQRIDGEASVHIHEL